MITKRFRVYGIVQGVGFRPTVSRHAETAGVTGTVSNMGPYVEIFAKGSERSLDVFSDLLKNHPPKRATIIKITEDEVADDQSFDGFSIIESEKTKGEIFISPDIAVCDDCVRELFDKNNRRYLHPFINCTCCGPRLTILDTLPYDRERTSMKEFAMCPECAGEYYSSESRRFDAQPVCCNDCGPEVYILEAPECFDGRNARSKNSIRGRSAITLARRIIKDGGIAAIKGIGGFHLCCDATNSDALRLLRERKNRPMKPFAVMAKNIETAKRECEITPAQQDLLCGHEKPIILLDKKNGGKVCDECAPDNPKLGLMLPYAPLQLLLFDYDDGIDMPDCLVMTSANTSGAPICRDDVNAMDELSHLCDVILSHNRRIRIRCDDSVLDFYNDAPYPVRRSRGYAPLPVPVDADFKGCVLGIGGELKNEFCIGIGNLFYMSAYIGDLEDIRTVSALNETVTRFETLLEAKPESVGCDMHPLYNSVLAAKETGLPVCGVQHHYAHVLSCMAENDHLKETIGVSFDGTGYGTDGTIWGGEILLCDLDGFKRSAHITPFLHVGGDAGSREGWRIAVSMIYGLEKAKSREGGHPAKGARESAKTAENRPAPDAAENAGEIIRALDLCGRESADTVIAMCENGFNTAVSTSCGRLFDAVCAVLGIRGISTFEGEAATALMYRALEFEKKHGNAAPDGGRYAPRQDADGTLIMPTERLFSDILKAKLRGDDTARLAFFFHEGLAGMITEACVKIREESDSNTAALTGGVFQNTLLLSMCEERLKAEGFNVLIHRIVPPNDGGIALGQAVFAMNRLRAPSVHEAERLTVKNKINLESSATTAEKEDETCV